MFEEPVLLEKIEKLPPQKITESVFEKVQTFFFLSVIISWSCWMLLLASAKGVIPLQLDVTGNVPGFLLYVGAMTGMWLAAVFLRAPGKGLALAEIKPMFAALGKWKKNLHWYPVAILVPLVAELLAPTAYSIAGGSVHGFDPASPDWLQVAVLLGLGVHFSIVLMIAGAGYLLPLLDKADIGRQNASFIATLITLAWLFPLIMLVVLQHMSSGTGAYLIEFVSLALMLFWLYYTARV